MGGFKATVLPRAGTLAKYVRFILRDEDGQETIGQGEEALSDVVSKDCVLTRVEFFQYRSGRVEVKSRQELAIPLNAGDWFDLFEDKIYINGRPYSDLEKLSRAFEEER